MAIQLAGLTTSVASFTNSSGWKHRFGTTHELAGLTT